MSAAVSQYPGQYCPRCGKLTGCRCNPIPLNVEPQLSNLARFAIMTAARPKGGQDLSIRTDADGVITHLKACRAWAQKHIVDYPKCYCTDTGICPVCTLVRCDCCDGDIKSEDHLCGSCFASANEALREADRDVRAMLYPRHGLHRRGSW